MYINIQKAFYAKHAAMFSANTKAMAGYAKGKFTLLNKFPNVQVSDTTGDE
jgi:hypothetical protein